MLVGSGHFPSEVWCLIGEKCDMQTFFFLESAIPELRNVFRHEIKIKLLLKDTLSVMYRHGYIDFEDVSCLKMVCVKFYQAVRALFSNACLDSVENLHMEKTRTSVVIWLPLRHVDLQRLQEMNSTIENGIQRCPALSGTLIIRFPFMKKDESLSMDEIEAFFCQIQSLLELFTSVEIEHRYDYVNELYVGSGWNRMTAEGRVLESEGRLWNEEGDEVRCGNVNWTLLLFKKMLNLKFFRFKCPCVHDAELHLLHGIDKLRSLDMICFCEPFDHYELIRKCSGNLERFACTDYRVAFELLVGFNFPKLLELQIPEGNTPSFKVFETEVIPLLARANFLPSLQKLVIVRIFEGRLELKKLVTSLRNRPSPVKLYTLNYFREREFTEVRYDEE